MDLWTPDKVGLVTVMVVKGVQGGSWFSHQVDGTVTVTTSSKHDFLN